MTKLLDMGLTEDQAVETIRNKDVPPDSTNVVIIEADDRPYRGSFRNAWRQTSATAPHVDMPAARNIKTAFIRRERNARLATADQELSIAEDDNDQAAVARARGKRKALRDMPATVQPDLDAITTPAELAVYEPAWPA